MTEKTGYLAGTPSWADLMTPDLEGAKMFYGSLFDWTFRASGPEMGNYNVCLMRGKQIVGMMQQGPEVKGMPSAWSVYFDSKNLDASLVAVKEAGGQIVFPAQKVGDLGIMAFATDPSGGAFGFWQAGKHTGSEIFAEVGAMAWHELRSRDLKAAIPFYQRVLGNKIEPMQGAATNTIEYHVQKANDLMHAGFMNMPSNFPAEVPSHWTVYFAVANADLASAKIKSLGGTVLAEPFDTPHGRNGYAKDKWGAPFTFIQMQA